MSGPEPAAPGWVVWITGLSGAGKTTLARAVVAALRGGGGSLDGRPVVLLDGDDFRRLQGETLGHGRDDRLENARRLAALAAFLAGQGVPVVVATMSLFREVHAWNRRHLEPYLEVYLRASIDFLADRDGKGLYRTAGPGRRRDVVGVDLPFDAPAAPDLVLDAEEARPPEQMAADVIATLHRKLAPTGRVLRT